MDQILQGYEWELYDLHRPHVMEELAALAQRGFDIYLNMCDGAADEDRPGLDVVLALGSRLRKKKGRKISPLQQNLWVPSGSGRAPSA